MLEYFQALGFNHPAYRLAGINFGEVNVLVRTLYVGNLPWSTTEEELAKAFSVHGEVISTRIITDRQTGRSRGFGFVEVSDADADRMVRAMNGAQLGSRTLTVNEARPRG